MSGDRLERERLAMHLYGQALAIVDPIRIRMWADADLTTGQVRLLVLLRVEPGATLSGVAAQLHVSAPTASGLVDRLVRQNFVRREEDARDRRFVRHHLTDAGAAIVGEIEREGLALLNRILSHLADDDLEALVNGLTLLNGAAATVAREIAEAEVTP